ncbi:MAG: hypothetical protein FWC15_00310 [Fibromonadales bacterium]|nr:hypothetical protein [Fibromonadales bacterium]
MSSLKETMLANLRELVKLQRAAHDSMFKFSITKIWPISLFTPQVDWIRITRMMDNLKEKCNEQKEYLANTVGAIHRGCPEGEHGCPEGDLPFLKLLPEYLDLLATVAEVLGRAAAYRQNVLEKKIKMTMKEWNSILISYNDASDSMTRTGILLHSNYELSTMQSG